jgi:L-seryl-tRNA(Ser) seleniumtransferase
LRLRAEGLSGRIMAELRRAAVAVPTSAYVGGGSVPADAIPSWAVRLDGGEPGPSELARRLRLGRPAAVGRVKDDALWLDLRAVDPSEDDALFDALRQACEG